MRCDRHATAFRNSYESGHIEPGLADLTDVHDCQTWCTYQSSSNYNTVIAYHYVNTGAVSEIAGTEHSLTLLSQNYETTPH